MKDREMYFTFVNCLLGYPLQTEERTTQKVYGTSPLVRSQDISMYFGWEQWAPYIVLQSPHLRDPPNAH
jgi:hypothetical protein